MFDQHAIVIAHGVLACVSWVIFFPLGAILVRVMKGASTWKVHAAIQTFSMAIFTAAVGTGLQMALKFELMHNYHVIIGLLVFALMVTQALSGTLHHVFFKKHHRRTVTTYVHLWLGRITITLGMINGGLGLLVNGRSTKAQNIGYGTVAGLIWWVWLLISVIMEVRRGEKPADAEARRQDRAKVQEKRFKRKEERKRAAKKEAMLRDDEDWI